MRDFFKFLIVGIVLFCTQQVYAGDYKVLVLPDNIVTENETVDAYIYNEAAEFFANEVVTMLNTTNNIDAPTISDTRALYKKDVSTYVVAKKLTDRFKTSYNVDSTILKKLANKSGARYVLLITSYIDYENYVLRRTLWDFLNIPGATVVDPAYKISTYAVLYDTKTNSKLWSDTYYKTISVCENRIITRGPSPQVEQLQKIKDYSRSLCPQIAQSVQQNILPAEIYATEAKQITDDMGNLDNVFTKKYRKYIKSTEKKVDKFQETRKERAKEKALKKEQIQEQNIFQTEPVEPQTKLEVKAQPVKTTSSNSLELFSTKENNAKNDVLQNETIKPLYKNDAKTVDDYYEKSTFDIKRTKTNPLINNIKTPPNLRDYNL